MEHATAHAPAAAAALDDACWARVFEVCGGSPGTLLRVASHVRDGAPGGWRLGALRRARAHTLRLLRDTVRAVAQGCAASWRAPKQLCCVACPPAHMPQMRRPRTTPPWRWHYCARRIMRWMLRRCGSWSVLRRLLRWWALTCLGCKALCRWACRSRLPLPKRSRCPRGVAPSRRVRCACGGACKRSWRQLQCTCLHPHHEGLPHIAGRGTAPPRPVAACAGATSREGAPDAHCTDLNPRSRRLRAPSSPRCTSPHPRPRGRRRSRTAPPCL